MKKTKNIILGITLIIFATVSASILNIYFSFPYLLSLAALIFIPGSIITLGYLIKNINSSHNIFQNNYEFPKETIKETISQNIKKEATYNKEYNSCINYKSNSYPNKVKKRVRRKEDDRVF